MKKKGIIIIVIGVFIVSTIVLVLISKNSKKYIMHDGIMLAMTLTDTNGNTTDITEFPSEHVYATNVNCVNAKGLWLPKEDGTGYEFVLEEIAGEVKCNIAFREVNDNDKLSAIVQTAGTCSNISYTTKSTCESNGETWTITITNANGYRYSGENPDNYVWFNNELWRIIGLVPVCTESNYSICTTRTNLVKIIRNESIGDLAYDAKSSGETGYWKNNTLYTLLNEYYYGRQDGTGTAYCYGYSNTAKTKCDYTKIGISSSNTDFYGKMIEPVHWNYGGGVDSTTPGTVYNSEKASVIYPAAKIGIMDASDYGYAALISNYGTNLVEYNTTAITGTNWLYGQNNEWTKTRNSDGGGNTVLYVSGNGLVYGSGYASSGFAIRPVLYLNAGVYKLSGSGKVLDPYIIGM